MSPKPQPLQLDSSMPAAVWYVHLSSDYDVWQHILCMLVNLCESPSRQYMRFALIYLASEELYKILFKESGSQITVLVRDVFLYISRDLNSKSTVE